jgi:hypothetical protein
MCTGAIGKRSPSRLLIQRSRLVLTDATSVRSRRIFMKPLSAEA